MGDEEGKEGKEVEQGKDGQKGKKFQKMKLDVEAEKANSQYVVNKKTKINGKSVELRLDLGGNIWILGFVDGGVLRMFKGKIISPNTFSIIGIREDAKYARTCGEQQTFIEGCFKSAAVAKNKDRH